MMKRMSLGMLSLLMVLALSGAFFAQTGYESPTQPADSPSSVAPQQEGTMGTDTGSATGGSMGDTGSTAPSTAEQGGTQESLPATASPLPLVFAIGMSALGATLALRTYRLRGSH